MKNLTKKEIKSFEARYTSFFNSPYYSPYGVRYACEMSSTSTYNMTLQIRTYTMFVFATAVPSSEYADAERILKDSRDFFESSPIISLQKKVLRIAKEGIAIRVCFSRPDDPCALATAECQALPALTQDLLYLSLRSTMEIALHRNGIYATVTFSPSEDGEHNTLSVHIKSSRYLLFAPSFRIRKDSENVLYRDFIDTNIDRKEIDFEPLFPEILLSRYTTTLFTIIEQMAFHLSHHTSFFLKVVVDGDYHICVKDNEHFIESLRHALIDTSEWIDTAVERRPFFESEAEACRRRVEGRFFQCLRQLTLSTQVDIKALASLVLPPTTFRIVDIDSTFVLGSLLPRYKNGRVVY